MLFVFAVIVVAADEIHQVERRDMLQYLEQQN